MFSLNYLAGGVIDEIRRLPYPHFSKKTIPYVRGRKIDVLAQSRVFSDTYSLPFDTEFLSIAIACSEYSSDDYWELTIGGNKICETVYTKQLPESVAMGNSFGLVLPVQANTELKFDFYNVSGAAKVVWYNIKFLR